MENKSKGLFIGTRAVVLSAISFFSCLTIIILFMNLFIDKPLDETTYASQIDSDYVILAANDLGMHCYQQDYSSFLILPPGNNLRVQVFRKGSREADLITSGIDVHYQMIENTTSANKINFWEYAADYGYDVPPNIGITGNGLSGNMSLSADGKYYEATAIPLTPYNDGSSESNPYQMAIIKVTDHRTGKLLAQIDSVVVPVSDEMNCSNCHGTTNPDLDILRSHDELSGTHLVADLAKGNRYKCSDCHKDNILGEPGKLDVLPLSQAMHGFHSDKMQESDVVPVCNNCHPGPETKCYRGIMFAEGVNCVNSDCHGDMANIAASQAEGRKAWLQEPDCANCHEALYAVNPDQLYRNSYLINNEDEEMNGFILCISCHNSPHAEWKSTNPLDNLLPESLLGYPSFIDKCTVCHEGSGKIHQTIVE